MELPSMPNGSLEPDVTNHGSAMLGALLRAGRNVLRSVLRSLRSGRGYLVGRDRLLGGTGRIRQRRQGLGRLDVISRLLRLRRLGAEGQAIGVGDLVGRLDAPARLGQPLTVAEHLQADLLGREARPPELPLLLEAELALVPDRELLGGRELLGAEARREVVADAGHGALHGVPEAGAEILLGLVGQVGHQAPPARPFDGMAPPAAKARWAGACWSPPA